VPLSAELDRGRNELLFRLFMDYNDAENMTSGDGEEGGGGGGRGGARACSGTGISPPPHFLSKEKGGRYSIKRGGGEGRKGRENLLSTLQIILVLLSSRKHKKNLTDPLKKKEKKARSLSSRSTKKGGANLGTLEHSPRGEAGMQYSVDKQTKEGRMIRIKETRITLRRQGYQC